MNNNMNQFNYPNDYNNGLNNLNYNDGKKNNTGTKIFIGSIIFLLLVIAGGVIFMTMKDKKSWFASNDAESQVFLKNVNLSIGDNVITYIPLDDRPVNVDRVQYLAGMAGYDLVMPNEAYYSTFVSSEKDKAKAGNPKKLAEFLLKQEAEGCDYYIISLDQLFSGGLMSSRAFLDEDFEDGVIDNAFKALEYIMNKKENKVYLFDTMLRLATSADYYGFPLYDDYYYTRSYFSAPRKVLKDDELTFENVVKTYTELNTEKTKPANETSSGEKKTNYYDEYTFVDKEHNNARDEYRYVTKDGLTYKMSQSSFDRELKIRERKLHLFERYIKLFEKKKAETFLTIGVDDSVVFKDNVQVNEIAYVEKLGKQYIKDFEINGSVDDAGVLMLTRLAVDAANVDLKVNIEYFTDKNKVGTDFGNETLEKLFNNISETAGVSIGDSKNAPLDILVWAYNDLDGNIKTATEEEVKVNKENYYKMINKYIDNINNNRPTVIIDDCENVPSSLKNLNLDLLNNAPVGYLLGYSSWNTVGNSSGIAMSQGIMRYLYLASNEQNKESDFAFLKSLSFGFVKDLGYKRYVMANGTCKLTESDPSLTNLVNCMNNNSISHVGDIINNLKNSNYISDIDSNGKFVEKGIADVSVNNYHFPWYRRFECNFDIKIDIKDSKNEVYINKISLDGEKKDDSKSNEEKKQTIIDNNKKDSSDSKKDSSNDYNVPRGDEEKESKDDSSKDNNNNNNNNNNDNKDNKENKKTYTKTVTHYAYIDLNGKYFDLNGNITRAEFAKWLCKSNNIKAATTYQKKYADVTRSTSNWEYIVAATNAGYLQGTGNSNYRPNDMLTRAEAITALLRVSEQNGIVYTKTCGYPYMQDVSSTDWYYQAMREGAHYCILEGNENKMFKPKANVTKAELSAMIYRTLLRSHEGYDCDLPSTNPFSNINTSHWAYTYLVDAYKTHTCRK